jgi:uncharacterized membrane protein YkvA (DUF1232 family)
MNSKHVLELFNVVKDYRLFIQMMKDKRYAIPLARKLLYIVLVVYIIIPFDFIPGVFPIIGMVDDLGAFAVIIGVLLYEIATYRDFLDDIRGRSRTVRIDEGGQLTEGKGPEDGRTEKGERDERRP